MDAEVKKTDMVFGLEEKPKPLEGILLGFQHVLVMFAAMVGVPLVLSSSLGLDVGTTQVIVSGVMVTCGICTIIQSLGVGIVGARLPIVQGATFKFIGPMVMAYNVGGFQYLFGATLLGGFVEIILAFFVGKVRKLFTKFLTGGVLLIIGLSLIPIGVNNFLAVGEPNFATPTTYFLGFLTLILIVLFNTYGKGLTKAASIIISLVIAYIVAGIIGVIDFTDFYNAAWIGFTSPFKFGMPKWPGFGPLFAISLVYLISLIETTGDTVAISTIVETEPTEERIRGSLLIDGLSGPISAIFNGFPMTSFTQNIGLVKLTGIGSRYIVAIGGGILIILGLCPKFATLISLMPKPILGAALIITFAMIATEGARQLSGVLESRRNQTVLGLAASATFFIHIAPSDAFEIIPSSLQVFVSDAMITGLLVLFILELIIPKVER